MIKHPNKILCVGSGCNIQHVTHFSETKEFVFIDSQPRIRNDKIHLEPKFHKKEYVSDFVNNLLLTCLYNGFILQSKTILNKNYYKKINTKKWNCISWCKKIPKNVNPTMLVFINNNTNQKIIYYISTNIIYNICDNLSFDISSCDAVIVNGYFPEIDILEYFGTSKIFIGYSGTNYSVDINDEYYKNSILYFLHNYSCNRQYFFSEFYVVENETGIISKCQNFDKFMLQTINFINKI